MQDTQTTRRSHEVSQYRRLIGVVVVAVVAAGAIVNRPTTTADAQEAVSPPSGVAAMVDSDGALQIRWDDQDPAPKFYAVRSQAVGEASEFERLFDFGPAQGGKQQFTVPSAGADWESAGVRTGLTFGQLSERTDVEVTDGQHEDVQLTVSDDGLNVSWVPNSFIDDEVVRTVLWHRPQNSSRAWTYVNLGVVEAQASGRFETTVPGIDRDDEVQLRVVYRHLGKTMRSDSMTPVAGPPPPPEPPEPPEPPTSLEPITEFGEHFWSIDIPNGSDGARAILVVGDTVFVGGDFDEVYQTDETDGSAPLATLQRDSLVAFDRLTGEPTSFDADFDGSASRISVFALAVSPDEQTLYVGGQFNRINGVARDNFAAFDLATGELTSFDPSPNGPVRALDVAGDRLYLGGSFTTIDGERRDRLARFELNGSSGSISGSWTPDANGAVKDIVVDENSRIWVGGDFTRINGDGAAEFLAVVDDGNGGIAFDVADLRSRSGQEVPVIAMAGNDGRIFVAGGGPGGTGYAYDTRTGDQLWTSYSDGNYQAVDAIGDHVYFGGHYGILFDPRDETVDRLSRHDAATGEWDQSWVPFLSSARGVNAIDVEADGLYVAGQFNNLKTELGRGGPRQEGWAVFAGETA